MKGEYDKAFNYDWENQRTINLQDMQERQFDEHYFPISIIGQGFNTLFRWFHEYEEYWSHKTGEESDLHTNNAIEFRKQIGELLEKYQVTYVELNEELSVDKICDIFTQVNSKGLRLDVFDLMNALLKPKDVQLKRMWRQVKSELEFVDNEKLNVYILQVMSILVQAYCSPRYIYFLILGQEKTVRKSDGSKQKEILIESNSEFKNLWNRAVLAMKDSVSLLRSVSEFGVVSSKYLPYVAILPVFSALQGHIDSLPALKRLKAQSKVRSWYWASVFSSRYSGSVESTSFRDFLDMKEWFDVEEHIPSVIEEFKTSLENLDLSREIKSGTSIYNGVFNLMVMNGAKDWFTGIAPFPDDLDDHHIVPHAWGESLRNTEFDINTVLNRTPLSSDTNRKVIRDRLPNEYLPELIENSSEETVRSVLKTHFISDKSFDILMRKPFGIEDFKEFIDERDLSIKIAIENLL